VTEWLERCLLGLKVSVQIQSVQVIFRKEMGTRLSSDQGKVKVVRKRSGTPPQLHHSQYNLAL